VSAGHRTYSRKFTFEALKPASVTARIEVNPGYDPEYPKDRFPFVVLVSSSNQPLQLRWVFCVSRVHAEARKAMIDGKGGAQ